MTTLLEAPYPSFFQKECFPFSLQSSFSYPKNGSFGVND